MKIYLLSPESVPMNQVLFPSMIKTFEGDGHVFVGNIQECDLVMIDLHTRVAEYNQDDIDKLCWGRKVVATFDEWDRGNMSSDEWPHPLTYQQAEVFLHINSDQLKAVHFCRLLDKTKIYSANLHPYEKPIHYKEPLLSKEELFNREFDICFIANISPSREKIAQALLSDKRLKCHVSLGAKKLPFNEFVDWHKRGKLFVSSGAGGMSNERKQCLFSIAGIIEERTSQLLLHELTDLCNCILINSPPTKEDLDTIFEIVNDKERLYEIYKNGYDFVKKYYSKEYIATNILKTIKKYL